MIKVPVIFESLDVQKARGCLHDALYHGRLEVAAVVVGNGPNDMDFQAAFPLGIPGRGAFDLPAWQDLVRDRSIGVAPEIEKIAFDRFLFQHFLKLAGNEEHSPHPIVEVDETAAKGNGDGLT